VYFVPFAFVRGLQTMQAGKISNYDSEQDHQPERGSRLYGIFSKNVFSFWIFSGTERKTYLCFCYKTEESFIFLFPAGIPVIPAFFIPGKNVLSILASLIYSYNLLFFDYTTKVHNILYCAIDTHIFLYYFNRYLIFSPKMKGLFTFSRASWWRSSMVRNATSSHQQPPAATSSHQQPPPPGHISPTDGAPEGHVPRSEAQAFHRESGKNLLFQLQIIRLLFSFEGNTKKGNRITSDCL